MTLHFEADVVHAVLAHLNDDHAEASRAIVHAFADATASDVSMVGLDGDGGDWEYTDAAGDVVHTRIPWPHEVTERDEVRDTFDALHARARERLGGRPHSR
ncbi:Protein of unknown function [Paramicrobacterium humi]|uniref:DUF2470 domain-containing protein n=1 Tax=Paramicrobacterium humi TaxID=640635 RepID=A0A1H4LQ66_9MICO|nr:DUF2470 domain-containing protein [Microbacterium humi]SEB72778.1 Protein of unknown function [Microbacterium humi]